MSRERDRTSSRASRNHDYLIKLRGIPESSTKDDIKKFLHPCRILNIHLFDNHGNSSDECLIDVQSENDVKDALKKRNQVMKNRYIEVFSATSYEYNFYMKHKGSKSWCEPVIRLNGLPYTCTMADVQNFFKDVEIARNGIYITRDMSDNAIGGGYVACVNMENAYKAIDLYDQKHMQHRYIELTPSTYEEAKKTIMNDAHSNGKQFAGEDKNTDKKRRNDRSQTRSRTRTRTRSSSRSRSRNRRRSRSDSRDRHFRPVKRRRLRSNRTPENHRRRSSVRHSSPAPSNRNGEYLIKMRGMPYTVVDDDIKKFFPSNCQPIRIEILRDHRADRPNGDGYVYFKTMDEVNEALKCDRQYMGSRYVELYFDSPRASSSNHQRSKSSGSSHRSSRSPSKTQHNENSRSRSESEN